MQKELHLQGIFEKWQLLRSRGFFFLLLVFLNYWLLCTARAKSFSKAVAF